MKDERKTKKQLISELTDLRERVSELEVAETQRKQAKKSEIQVKERTAELAESEERFRTLICNIPGMVYRGRPDWTVEIISNSESICGYAAEEFSSGEVHWTDLIHTEDRKRVFEEALRIERKPERIVQEYRITRKDGKIRWVRDHKVSRFIEGKFAGVDGIVYDVTERKRAEEALCESEEKYRSLVENSMDGIAIVKGLELRFVNKTMLRMFGFESEDEMVEHTFTEFVSPKYRNLMAERGLSREKGDDVPSQYEFKALRKDGTEFNAEIAVTNIAYNGTVARQGIIRDITGRKLAEKELRRSREELRNLSAHLQSAIEQERTSIAREIHDELGQGLTVLKMELSWLGKKIPKDQEILLDKIKSMSEGINRTIRTVQRISSELRPALLDDFGLSTAIEWQGEEFQKRTGIRCGITLDPEDIALDKERSTAIFRIFQETLTNIARHANATKVKVNLKQKNGKLVLKVRDDGKGVTEKQISDPKSFGLIGIRERAHFFGGKVKITGIQNKGTTVTVSIPLEKKVRD